MRNLDIKELISLVFLFFFSEERLSSYHQCLHICYFACRQKGMYSASATVMSTKIRDREVYFTMLDANVSLGLCLPLPLPSPALCPFPLSVCLVEREFQKQQTNAFWLSVAMVLVGLSEGWLTLSYFLENINNCSKFFMRCQSYFTIMCCRVGVRSKNVEYRRIIRS